MALTRFGAGHNLTRTQLNQMNFFLKPRSVLKQFHLLTEKI